MKVLFYGEPPTIETGLAQVGKQHIKTFMDIGLDIHAVCINMFARDYDKKLFPFVIESCPPSDAFNRENMHRAIRAGDYDVLFFSADCGNVDVFIEDILYMRGQKTFKVVAYIPVDCDIIGPQPFRIFSVADYNYTYSEHGKLALHKIVPIVAVKAIPLGIDPTVFYPLDPVLRRSLRRRLWGIGDETFVCINVSRNQWRKDLARALYGFHLFHTEVSDSLLYMNSKQQDIGGSLPSMADILGLYATTEDPLTGKREVYFPSETFTETSGVSTDVLNEIYNIADCYVSSSTGEGWGLPIHEAMACKIPILVPKNTAHLDFVGPESERGYYIQCGGPDLWIMPYGLTHNPRDIVSCTSIAKQLSYIHTHREEAQAKSELAYTWALAHTWEVFQTAWREELTWLKPSEDIA